MQSYNRLFEFPPKTANTRRSFQRRELLDLQIPTKKRSFSGNSHQQALKKHCISSAFRRLISFPQTPLDYALEGFDGLLEQVVEGDLAVDEINGMFVGGEAIGGNHHGLDEDSFLDGITQYLHFVSD